MIFLFIAMTGFFGYYARQEFGVDRTILTVLATICAFAALSSGVN